MMHLLAAVLGVALIVIAIVDLLWTTFLEGAGPLATRASVWLGRMILRLHRKTHVQCARDRRWLARAGLITVCVTLLIWATMFWLGWGLVFNGSSRALVDASTGQPAGFWARIYFAGYTISTVGLGDYKPVGAFWQMVVALAGGSGFLLFGLAIAYIVPVVSAATQKRQLALCIWALGRDPADIIVRAWNGADTTALGPHLVSLTAMLALLGESHVTYPGLHFFHSTKRSSAAAPNVAALDEALTILECGLQRGCSLDLPALGAARESISEFLNTLGPAFIEPAKTDPPAPSLAGLKAMGVQVVEDELFHQALAGLKERRRMLLALVQNEGWTWEAVWPAQKASELARV